jgi:hypothetical protein
MRSAAMAAAMFVAATVLLGTAQAAGTGGSRISIIKRKSFCLTRASSAKLYVYVTLHNKGYSTGSIDLRPWRRYSDGSVNDSVLDTFTVKVRAGQTKKVYSVYNYNAQDHALLGCGLYVNDGFRVIHLRVVRI